MSTTRNFPWYALLLAALLVSNTADAAKLYKWTDGNGKINYSERPPSDITNQVESTAVKPEPEPVDDTPIEAPMPTDMAAAQQAAEHCQGLLQELDNYTNRAQITDSEGHAIVISAEMREAKLSEIKAELDNSCR